MGFSWAKLAQWVAAAKKQKAEVKAFRAAKEEAAAQIDPPRLGALDPPKAEEPVSNVTRVQRPTEDERLRIERLAWLRNQLSDRDKRDAIRNITRDCLRSERDGAHDWEAVHSEMASRYPYPWWDCVSCTATPYKVRCIYNAAKRL